MVLGISFLLVFLLSCLGVLVLGVRHGVDGLNRDGQILLEFKMYMVDYSDTANLKTWNESDSDPCNWWGVTCGPNSSNVSQLNLYLVGGVLVPALGSLGSLQILNLNNNMFTGPIPAELGNLSNLIALDLADNSLSGSIPTSISTMRSLQLLWLSSNRLTGPIPNLQGLQDLRELDLSNNLLTGNISNLVSLTKLYHLGVAFLGALGGNVSDFNRLVNLKRLDASGNNLGGGIPNLEGLRNLTVLRLASNALVGPIPEAMWTKVPEEIDLSYNQLSGTIPRTWFQDRSPIRSVNLSGNSLHGEIPAKDTWTSLPNLLTLDLSSNKLVGRMPRWISNEGVPSLATLWLQNNQLVGNLSDPQTLDLSLTAALTELRLGSNSFTGNVGPHSFNLRILEVLDLSHNQLVGQISTAYSNTYMPSLTWLDLSGNQLREGVPYDLLVMKNLVFLNLSYNHLSGPLPPIPHQFLNAALFAGNPGLCGSPLPPCQPQGVEANIKDLFSAPASAPGISSRTRARTRRPWHLVATAGGVLVLGVALCGVLLWGPGWPWAKQHLQDADLVAAMQDKERTALMSLRDLRKATANFSDSFKIGEGGCGMVYAGRLSDGTIVAIKKSKREASDKDKHQFLNEVRILSKVNHRHLVRLLGCCLEKKVAVLVFDYVSNGTLREHLQGARGARLSWQQRLRVALQTAEALYYLHSAADPPIFHRDVKSSNILLDQELNAKVADFGISKLAPLEATHISTQAVQGTMGYIDPQYYQSFQFTGKSDVYSFGVVLLELLSAQAPVDFNRGGANASLAKLAVPLIREGQLNLILDPAIADVYDSAEGKDSINSVGNLAMQCLCFHSGDRPSMKEVVQELQKLLE